MDSNVNANFLNPEWWQTAMPKDVAAEIEKGADVNAVSYDKNGRQSYENPLYHAVKAAEMHALGTPEQKKIYETNVSILLSHGANVHSLKGFALYSLWLNCNLDILDILINAGLDINQHISNFDNETLLSLATKQEQEKVVLRLLDAGAKDIRTSIEKN